VSTLPDPIDSDDPAVLKAELLRQRDLAHGETARAVVLADRVSELENELATVGAYADDLRVRLERTLDERARRRASRIRQAARSRR
jgi:hypothetical protein